MEFRLVAKLDSNGCLQSMQSNCIQQQPGVSSDNCNDPIPLREIKPPEKELVYKLDAKIDEMSLLMIQLDELSKRVKLQDKLIKEYEEKDKQKSREINRLKYENDRLRSPSANMVRIRPSSWESSMSCTTPKTVRSSITNIKMECSLQTDVPRSPENCKSSLTGNTEVNTKTTIGMDELDCALNDEHDRVNTVFQNGSLTSETLSSSSDTRNTKLSDFRQVSSGRPTFLAIGNAHVPSTADIDNSNVVGDADFRPIPSRRCGSDLGPCLDREGDIISLDGNEENETSQVFDETGSLAESFNNEYVKDQYGYVILTGNNTNKDTMPDSDVAVSNEAENNEPGSGQRKTNKDIEKHERPKGCAHTAWSDVNVSVKMSECNTSKEDQWVYKPDIKCHFFISQPGYVEIPPEEVPDRPPLPIPSQKCTSAFNFDLTGSNKYKNRPLIPTPKERSTKYSSSSSVESNESPTTPCCGTLNRRNENEDKTSTCACAVNKKRDREFIHRHSSPDLRKDDKSNSLIKTMRTTMEWNQTKKALMGRSHTCTNEQAEEVLRGVVQNTHHVCEQLPLKYQQRTSHGYSTTKVIHFIRKSVKNSFDEEILTDEFLKKCLEIWNNVKHCKTP